MRRSICTVVAVAIAVPSVAHAIPYETFIDVDDEADLQDLLASNDISQDTFDELIDLLDEGVDLNTADRAELYTLPNLTYEDVDKIIAYRSLQKNRINDPADLVAAGALTQEQLLSIAAFIIVRPKTESPIALHGWMRLSARMSYKDKLGPPLALRTRVTAMRHLTVGLAVTTTRLEIGEPVYDPNRNALIADPAKYSAKVPKAYAKWEDNDTTAILGSYRAGFAQRLVFDNTRHYTPNGLYLDDQVYYSADLTTECKQSAGELLDSPCTGAAGYRYVTPDWVWRDSLFGVGAGLKHVELQTGWLQFYGFASASRRSVYQYELVVHKNPDGTDHCADPHADSDPACGAPTVFVKPSGDLLTPTQQFAYTTLPNLMLEKLAGANATYFLDRRNAIGITGYGAEEQNLVNGIDLDFQEWSTHPFGKRFGAMGANFTFGRDWYDLAGEAALSYDNMPKPDPALTKAKGGGGPAGILRFTATKKHEELEVTGRYYSTDYLNPYARPISQPDEFDGMRARDEAGGRIRYVRNGHDFQLRTAVDYWYQLSTSTPKLDAYARANVRTTDELWLGLWERYQDKDLTKGGHDQCYEVTSETDPTGAPVPCAGRQLTTIIRAHWIPSKDLTATLMLEHQLLDDNTKMQYLSSYRQDVAVWAIVLWKPSNDLRLRGRVRYLDTAIDDDTYLERSFSATVDSTFRLRDADSLRVRVDYKDWLDMRTSTLMRVPNPELSLWLTYEARL